MEIESIKIEVSAVENDLVTDKRFMSEYFTNQ